MALVDLPSVDLPSAAFSGDAGRFGVVGVASTSRFCASSFAVIPRYLDARDPAVIPLATPSDEAEVEENVRSLRVVGRAVILERGRKRPHNGGQAKYCVLSGSHTSVMFSSHIRLDWNEPFDTPIVLPLPCPLVLQLDSSPAPILPFDLSDKSQYSTHRLASDIDSD